MYGKLYTVIDFINDNLSTKDSLDSFVKVAQTKTIKELSQMYGVKYGFMRKLLFKLNITPLRITGGRKKLCLTEKYGAEFIRSHSVDEISVISGVSRSYVKYLLRLEGHLPKKCHSNETLFAFENPSLRNIYYNMIKRCYDNNNASFKHYGKKGIVVCEKWKNSCRNFYAWAQESGYKKGLTLERKDVTKGYSPDNCCWIHYKRQAYNKHNSIKITYKGETRCLGEWARILGINYDTLYDRIFKWRWEIERAFETQAVDILNSRNNLTDLYKKDKNLFVVKSL